ncbi:MAG TPA: TonB-dependent receptor [Solimonas sp.]|nr:TonB-dependent receptor [Solimonas sp.]
MMSVLRLVSLALLSSVGPQAWAEATALSPIQVTAGRDETAAARVPQAMTVLLPEQIESQVPQTWTDLLRGTPGVFLQSSGPGQGIIIVRGLKGSEVLHLVDGMRLNNSFFRNSPSQYIALVDPYNIARVELQRGPAATMYGSDAMGGVVQVLTPEERFEGDDWEVRAQTRLQYGSADLGRVARVSAATGNRTLSFSGGFSFMDFGERDLGDGGREDLTDYLARGYDSKLLWAPSAEHEFMLSGQYFEYPDLPRYFEVVGGPGGAGNSVQANFRPNDRRFLHARYRHLGAFGPVEGLQIHVARQVINDDRFRQPNGSRTESEQNRSTLDGLTLHATTTLTPAARLRYGLEVYQDRVDSAKTRTAIATAVTTRDLSTFPDGSRQDSLGVYSVADWHVLPAWQLEAGLRYSRVHTDLAATPASAAAEIDDDGLTGHLGSLLRLTPKLGWTLNLARGFRAPNIFDLGTLGPRPGSSPQQVNVPNPDLRAESIDSLDTGLRWTDDGLSLEVVAWMARYKDRIEPREPTGNTVPDGQFGCTTAVGCLEVQSRNISEAEYWGVESGIRWRLGLADLYAVLNWTYGQESRGGTPETPANRVPPFNGQVGASLALPAAISVEPYLLFADDQQRLDGDDRGDVRIDPQGTPGWASLNLRLAWQALPGLRLQAEGRNLLDKAYREHGSGVDAAGAGLVLSLSGKWGR